MSKIDEKQVNWSGAPPWKIGTGAIAPVAPLPLQYCVRTPPPHPGKSNTFILQYGWPFSYLSRCGGLLLRFFFYLWGGPFSPCKDLSDPFLSMWGPFLLRFSASTYGGPFSPCEGLSSPFFSMWGGGRFFFSHRGLLWAGAQAYYIYHNIVMLKCINIQIYKITVIIPTLCTY